MYTTNEAGILNTYAAEPKVYFATAPSPEQQQYYTVQAAIASALVVFSLFAAFAVS